MNTNPAKRTNVFFSRNFRLVFLGALVSELGALLSPPMTRSAVNHRLKKLVAFSEKAKETPAGTE